MKDEQRIGDVKRGIEREKEANKRLLKSIHGLERDRENRIEHYQRRVKEIKELQNELEELENAEYFSKDDTCYTIYTRGNVSKKLLYGHIELEDKLLSYGNISKSLGYITETARMVKMMQRLRLWKEQNDPDFIPDWKDPSQQKWYIYKDEGSYETIYANTAIMLGSVHFSSQNIAERAIEEVCKVVEVVK